MNELKFNSQIFTTQKKQKNIYQPSSKEVILTFKFYFMCLGFTGSPSLKSKADALKYAIEFTAIGEYPQPCTRYKEGQGTLQFYL